MKTGHVTWSEPKDKKSALNLAAYIYRQMEIHNRRKENLVMNKSNAEEKIQRLQNVLKEITSQIETVDTTQSNWQKHLEILKPNFLSLNQKYSK